jgi:deazaflavin-dependent oxidoreductase (nitroreductase family)
MNERAAAERMPSIADSGLADLLGDLSRPQRAGVLLGRIVGAGRLGSVIARVMRSPMRARRLTTAVTRAHARLFARSHGRMRRSWLFAAGQPVMALTTTGRRSGIRHTTPVTAFVHAGKLAAAGMNLGMERNPGWSYNLRADPDAWITVGGHTHAVKAHLTSGAERDELWERWTTLQPSAEAFARLAGREVPIFVFESRT